MKEERKKHNKKTNLGQPTLLGALRDLGGICVQHAAILFTVFLVLRPCISLANAPIHAHFLPQTKKHGIIERQTKQPQSTINQNSPEIYDEKGRGKSQLRHVAINCSPKHHHIIPTPPPGRQQSWGSHPWFQHRPASPHSPTTKTTHITNTILVKITTSTQPEITAELKGMEW